MMREQIEAKLRETEAAIDEIAFSPNPGTFVSSTKKTRLEGEYAALTWVLSMLPEELSAQVGETQRYHVAIPYFFHFYVDATSEAEALTLAHEGGNGQMGDYDDNLALVETVPTW